MSLTYHSDAPCVSPPDVVDAAEVSIASGDDGETTITVARRSDTSAMLWMSAGLDCAKCGDGRLPGEPTRGDGTYFGSCSGCGEEIATSAAHLPAWATSIDGETERCVARRLAAEHSLTRLRGTASATAAAAAGVEACTDVLLRALRGDDDSIRAERLRNDFYRWAASIPPTPSGDIRPPHPAGPALVAKLNIAKHRYAGAPPDCIGVTRKEREQLDKALRPDSFTADCVGLTAVDGGPWLMRVVGVDKHTPFERMMGMPTELSAALGDYVEALRGAAGRAGAVRVGDMAAVEVPGALHRFDAAERRRAATQRRSHPPESLTAACGESVTCGVSGDRIVMFADDSGGVYTYDIADLYGAADMTDDDFAAAALACAAEHTAAATAENTLLARLSAATPSFGMAM